MVQHIISINDFLRSTVCSIGIQIHLIRKKVAFIYIIEISILYVYLTKKLKCSL